MSEIESLSERYLAEWCFTENPSVHLTRWVGTMWEEKTFKGFTNTDKCDDDKCFINTDEEFARLLGWA